MRVCLTFALALALLTPTAPAAAQSWADDDLRIQLRDTVRDAVRDARTVVRIETRDAGRLVRDVMRDVRHAMRDVRHDMRDVRHDVRDLRRDLRHLDGLALWEAHDGQRQTDRATSPTDDPCGDRGDWGRGERHCEVRDERLAAFAGTLSVNAAPNGGISVQAWDQDEILVRAIVNAQAETEADAKRIASEVQVQTGGGRIAATGPDLGNRRRESWHVSYRVFVPARTNLDLNSRNGGIAIRGVQGSIRFETTNGGVTLADLGGDVRGATRNGGLNVTLGGAQWDGAGLDVETSNGGVNLRVPDGYSAELTARTVNGGLRSEVPLTVQGRIDREINSTLGSGGAPVRVRTTNGGLRITRR
ncbi:MAG: DUF4097 family beta strand repeat-containing protein [Vicinamibacterales bacterium]|nr:DUF4097 family beta strand repeat-containing protein [Vicinamibacterales bacterium]